MLPRFLKGLVHRLFGEANERVELALSIFVALITCTWI
jgi:hypothetical protein